MKVIDRFYTLNLAAKYQKSVAQIIFKWDIRQDIALLTKTEKKARLISND